MNRVSFSRSLKSHRRTCSLSAGRGLGRGEPIMIKLFSPPLPVPLPGGEGTLCLKIGFAFFAPFAPLHLTSSSLTQRQESHVWRHGIFEFLKSLLRASPLSHRERVGERGSNNAISYFRPLSLSLCLGRGNFMPDWFCAPSAPLCLRGGF
jgi:hypothetical protein